MLTRKVFEEECRKLSCRASDRFDDKERMGCHVRVVLFYSPTIYLKVYIRLVF